MDGDTEMLKARIDNMVTEIRLLQQNNLAADAARAQEQARFDKFEARLDKWFICQIAVLIISISTLIITIIERWR